MNPGPADMYYQTHMSTGQAPPPQTVTSQYPHPQPPLLQPGHGQYSPAPYPGQYSYANGLTSPPAGPPQSNVQLPLPGVGSQGSMGPTYQQGGYDTTGQVAPPGMKPRVTATLWEDEGSLCFQVEARGICVARREDNHMINGTKLLNVAGMTRGRRDGILKSEKVRHVVKIGPMHLKGVWIPFERALDFANKEKITELLYPLFVHNIGALLYHPTNQNRTSQVMAVAEHRRKTENQMRNQPPGGLPSLQQHHHHSMLSGPQQPPLPSHHAMGRPSLDRSNTFPTPPTSASSVMNGMGASENFQWSQQGMGSQQGNPPMSIDTSLSNARSLPNTPATTPPGSTIQSMQPYPPVSQPYDSTRQPMYQAPPSQQSPYPPSTNSQDRNIYGQNSYVKSEMGPPSSRSVGEQAESKPANGMMHPGQNESVAHQGQEDEAEHDHDGEYTHDSGNYEANRGSYNYSAPPVNSLPNEHSHISPEISGSPHQAGSGRATPRTAAAPSSYYSQPGYHSPRSGQQSSNLYSVMSNDRGTTNGTSGNDVYSAQPDMNNSMQNGYAPQPPAMNGSSGGMKRGRDDEDDRPTSGGGYDIKRRKTMLESSGHSPSYNSPITQAAPAIASQRRR
ncbi:cell pattern formation-associated protein stuA [Rhypophila decipiens]|uniref:Cell pattern formation-associated protein stuA n=1 Tax=Rhypophila decipiens TaxID=261697 RepID=A0AAN7BFB3_9PEZI|nr:cell pattern formation-associated protein stuA [Rhypophila decipiens]